MAPSHDEAHIMTAVITYMRCISRQTSSRQTKKVARSPELKDFLMYLSKKEPKIMDKLLKSVSRKCEETLEVEKESREGKKRAEPPNCNESITKRPKLACVTEEETARQPAVDHGEDVSMEEEDPAPRHNPRSSDIALAPISTSVKDIRSTDEITRDVGPTIKPAEKKRSNVTSTSIRGHQKSEVINLPTSYQTESGHPGKSQFSKVTLRCTPSSEKDDRSRCEISEQDCSTASGEKNTSKVAIASVDPGYLPTADCGLPSGPQYSEMALQSISALKNDEGSRLEDSEKDGPNTKPKAICGQQKTDTVNLPTAYEIESGLSNRSSKVENHVRDSLLALEPSSKRSNIKFHAEITKIWRVIDLLDFFKVKCELYLYLIDREKMPGRKLQDRTNWDTNDPSEIFDKLNTVRRNTIDNKMHRAYGQMILLSLVDAEVSKGYKSKITGHRAGHTALLEDLARKKAGPVSKTEIDKTIADYFYEYYAGQKWLAVIDWFGGSGIVLVFLVAGVGSYYVETRWTEFQRSCVQHIAGLLHSIRRLVETLGSDALEDYCRNGSLGSDSIDRVESASFTKPDKDEESEDEESEDGESADERAKDEESEDERLEDKQSGDESSGHEGSVLEEPGEGETEYEECGDDLG